MKDNSFLADIKKRIEEKLKEKKPLQDLANKSMDELMEELNIYYHELEVQNDELCRIQQDLEISKKHFFDLFEDAPIGYVIYDCDLNIHSANRLFWSMAGIPKASKKNDETPSITKFIDPESQDKFYFHIQSILKKREPHSCQIEIKGMKQVYPVKIESNLWQDGSNTMIRSAIVDLSKERETEELYRHLYETMGQGVIYQNMDGNIISANSSALKILGLSMDQIFGRTSYDSRWKAIRKDGSPFPGEEHPAMITLKTGQAVYNGLMGIYNPIEQGYRWILVNSMPQFKKGETQPYQVYAIFTDITEQKKAEDKLRENQVMLQSIIDSLPGMLNVIAPNYDIITMNHNNLKNKAQSENHLQDVSGKKCYDVLMQRNSPCPWCKIEEVLESQKPLLEVTEPNDPREELTGKALQIYLFPILYQGSALGVVEYSVDVTGLRDAKLEAEKANKAKSNFLASMSHEIRTPLNGVVGFIDLLMSTNLTVEQRKYIQNAKTSAHLLLGIINDILDFSKIEAGKLELEEIKTDLVQLVEESTDIIKYAAMKKGLEVLINIAPDVPRFIFVDPLRLKQILMNLLGNATKFTQKGEIEISIQCSTEGNTGNFSFMVRDTGIGISEEHQNKLFKAFYQTDVSITRKFGGTGLGLVISSMLVEKMGGQLQLSSKPEEGSSFFFSISKPFEKTEEYDLKKIEKLKEIIIIDDHQKSRNLLQDILQKWNIQVHAFDNGIEALKYIEKTRSFDVLIVDQIMPYLNGLETIQIIQKKSHFSIDPKATILLQSTIDAEDVIEGKYQELKIDYRIGKPIKVYELFECLSSICRKGNSKEELLEPETIFASKNKLQPLILIAEDFEMNRVLLKSIVSKIFPKAKTLEAEDGEVAIKLMIKHKPDLILMDIQMPNKDGYESSREIRQYEQKQSSQSHTPIVALTASTQQEEKNRCLDAGMDDYLTKPIDPKQLEFSLNRLLSK